MRNVLATILALSILTFAGNVFAEQPAEAEPEPDNTPSAWFRLDSDTLSLQVWAGATHSVSLANP